ncbi:FAD-dependent monooxygenase [Nocardia sp. KC 131]|uniref:FAD-dependent monooxygenase n=1 Tax=Nocardia arseniciresistens TaxID=3392119 RepID=UPI00398E51A4
MLNRSVLIAGAGIGGLTAALTLHAAGHEVAVIESSRTISPLGVGVSLQPEAVAVLTELGLADELADLAVATTEHVYIDRYGTVQTTQPRGTAAGHRLPQYSVHRGELQSLLLAAVRSRLGDAAVRTGARLSNFEQTDDVVRVQLDDRLRADTETVTADALVGADGIHSVVRARLHQGPDPLRWSGMQIWRGVVEGEPFLDGQSMAVGKDEHGRRFVSYPIGRRANGRVLLNWVAMVPLAEPQPLPATDVHNSLVSSDDVLRYFEHWSLSWLNVAALIAATPEILRHPMVDRDPLDRWGRGRVTLLGDAAHPMYPVGANGATQAILDAEALARALPEHSAETALTEYESERRPATTTVVLANRTMENSLRGGDNLTDITTNYRTTVSGPGRQPDPQRQ